MAWNDSPPQKHELNVIDDWTSKPPSQSELQDAVSPTVSAIRKGVQGASAGMLDEASGIVEAGGRAVGLKGLGGSFDDVERDPRGMTFSYDQLKEAYELGRNRKREYLKKDEQDNPQVSNVAELAGAVVSPVNKVLPNASLAKQGAAIGAITGFGNSDANNIVDTIKDTALGAGGGFVVGKGFEKAAPIVGKAGTYVSSKLGSAKTKLGQTFGKTAEDLAENATGATRVQSEKFSDGSGRYLLDEGIVGFGDDVENVAAKANKKISEAEKKIDSSLRALDEKGVKVSQDKIVEKLESKINELKKDSSQADVVRKLETIIEDITKTGESNLSASSAEQVKRGFNKMAKNWQDPEKGQAGKVAYRAYRDAVEESAQAADKTIAETFKEGKSAFGKLNPIADAAEKRASQLKQSPIGGLLDTAAVIGGAAGSDDPLAGGALGITAALARRKVAPRISSTIAVTFDNISKQLLKTPQYAQLAKSNPKVFNATVHSFVKQLDEIGAQNLPKVAEQPKGEEKWANDGGKKLIDSGIDQNIIDQLKKDRKGRELLIDASRVSPNSKAMENIKKKIRTGYLNKGDN